MFIFGQTIDGFRIFSEAWPVKIITISCFAINVYILAIFSTICCLLADEYRPTQWLPGRKRRYFLKMLDPSKIESALGFFQH